MTEKECCPLCEEETRSSCSYCNGTGEVAIPRLEGALYKTICSCGHEATVAWDVVGPLALEQSKCPLCQKPLLFEFSGWGSVD